MDERRDKTAINGRKTMKILVIMGSPRKGHTFRACEEFRELLQQECAAEFEYLWIKDAHLLPCKGCLSCFGRGEDTCPNRDDVPALEQKMREADAVVFASPVYGFNVTGLMKTFIDRFSYFFHRPRFFDKKAFVLATAGVMGLNDVLSYLEKVAGLWGFEVVGTAGLIMTNDNPTRSLAEKNKKILKKAAKEFSTALQRNKRKSPGIMDVIIFHSVRAAFSQLERVSPFDYQYWKNKGWFSPGVRYFVDIPVNPLFLAAGRIAGWLTLRQVRKNTTLE